MYAYEFIAFHVLVCTAFCSFCLKIMKTTKKEKRKKRMEKKDEKNFLALLTTYLLEKADVHG